MSMLNQFNSMYIVKCTVDSRQKNLHSEVTKTSLLISTSSLDKAKKRISCFGKSVCVIPGENGGKLSIHNVLHVFAHRLTETCLMSELARGLPKVIGSGSDGSTLCRHVTKYIYFVTLLE